MRTDVAVALLAAWVPKNLARRKSARGFPKLSVPARGCLTRFWPPGRCSGQLRGQLRHGPIAPAGQGLRYSSTNGGDHAADDSFRRQRFRLQRAVASRDRLQSTAGRAGAPLSVSEKRAILASCASDASAIASCPVLRAPAGLKAPVTIDEILEALCDLDGGPNHPPGGKPNRLRSTSRVMAA